MAGRKGSLTGRCQGCNHPERVRIERFLATGAAIKGAARKFAIDYHALRRQKRPLDVREGRNRGKFFGHPDLGTKAWRVPPTDRRLRSVPSATVSSLIYLTLAMNWF